MRRDRFLRIVDGLSNYDPFFQQKPNCAGELGLSTLQKCTAALGMLAYGAVADATNEYLRIGETTANKSLKKFTEGVVALYGNEYLRKPSNEDMERLLNSSAARGFPGMIGSIDCMHWEWKNCPAAWKGSCNDLNVLYQSPVFDDVLNGRTPPANYNVNGRRYKMAYYLTDGIYPQWAAFISGITHPQTNKHRVFAERQAAVRKDVERAFGVLQARFAIIRKPSLAWDEDILSNIMNACTIFHNMIVEVERDIYSGYEDPSEFNEDLQQSIPSCGLQHTASSRRMRVEDNTFTYNVERPFNMGVYLVRRDEVHDRHTHQMLKEDLIEHNWNKYGRNN